MTIHQQIPETDGVKDPKAASVLGAIKAILEDITGRSPIQKQIVKLGANANLSGVINKVNEIIDRLQG